MLNARHNTKAVTGIKGWDEILWGILPRGKAALPTEAPLTSAWWHLVAPPVRIA